MIESELRTESSKYNAGTKAKQQIHEERNTAENWHQLVEKTADGNYKLIDRARDIGDEPKRTDHAPCFVISSGPSLDDNIAALRDWKGAIFCGTSHATTLMYHGIEPTHIVVLDPFCAWHEIAGVDWSKTKTKLIVNPSVWPDIFANWPNEIILYLQNIGRRDSYYATTQLHMFCRREPDDPRNREPRFLPMIRTELTLFACTPPAQIFVADILGYGRCFLMGADFAYSPTLSRFTRWQPDAAGVWQKEVSPYVPSADDVTTDNGLVTGQIHLYYKKNFLSAWRLSRQELWSVDQWTSVTEIPHVSMDRVIKDQGEGLDPIGKQEIIRRTESYLARVGAYIIRRPDDNVSFVESPNPLNDLPIYMAGGRRIWQCMKCHGQGNANDDNDHAGETCPVCGNVGMSRAADCDIEANMERIKGLVAEADRENGKGAIETTVEVISDGSDKQA